MKKIKVRLSLLDKIKAEGRMIGYDNMIRVAVAGDRYEIIGSGSVHVNGNGNHYAELFLDGDVDHDLYYYYTNLTSEGTTFWLSGIQLNEKEIPGNPTTQLKDMIIN